jgi:diguanylate cyclase (GGDEF)-like protein/PAS domain S-box-containing protein
MMDALSALLRTAIRIADARAALVAFDDDPTPVAFQGCSLGVATAALRDGDGAVITCPAPAPAPSPAASLVLLGAAAVPGGTALDAVARELGMVMLQGATRVDERLASLAASVELLADAVMITRDPEAGAGPIRIAYVNIAFERLFGYTQRDLDGSADDVLFSEASRESVDAVRARLRAGEPVRSIIVAMRSRDDDALWIDLTARVVRSGADDSVFSVFTLRDITARRAFESAAAAEKQRLMVTLKAIGDGVITVLPDGRIDFVNAAAQRMLRVTHADAFGSPLRSLVRLLDDHNERREIALDPQGDVRGEGRFDDAERQLHLSFVSSPIVAPAGTTLGFVIVLRDVTAQARLTRRLAYEASHDALTRLPNRRHFEEMIGIALESARARGTTHTVAYIDLDRFKQVNDTFGHQAGDTLLRELAYRMSRNVRGNDVLARIGGDEFALLLHECTTDNAARVAEKIRESVETASRELAGAAGVVGASLGLAPLTADAIDAAAVLDAADRACYAAKAAGRNAVIAARPLTRDSN